MKNNNNNKSNNKVKKLFRIGHFRPFVAVPKQVLLQNLSYEHEFDLNENEPVGGNHF